MDPRRNNMDSLVSKLKKMNMDSAMSSGLMGEMEALLAAKQAKAEERRFVIRPALQTDVLFLLDGTVSMKPNRDTIVKHLSWCIDMLSAVRKEATVRVAVVVYRDFKITPRFSILPFTALGPKEGGTEAVRKWLADLQFQTDVSQDFPEDVHGGLEEACKETLGWAAPSSRIVLHIADAPGHGKRLKDTSVAESVRPWNADDHPDYDQDGSELRKLMLRLREDRKVNAYGLWHVPTEHRGEKHIMTHVMAERMREAAGDPAWVQEYEWEDDQFPLQLLETVGESVRSSISFVNNFVDRKHTIVKEEPNWDAIPAVDVQVTKHNHISSIGNLLKMIAADKHLGTYEVDAGRIKVAPQPFACGKARLVYYGRYYAGGGSEFQEVVLKEFIAGEGQANKAIHYKAQMETHTVASFLADQFNAHAEEKNVKIPKVVFVECTMVCVTTNRKQRFMLMEERCTGPAVKFNNNCGDINFFDPQPHLQAFSHWTHVVTDEKLMVVDVQGFKMLREDGDVRILLSDPAMHCVSQGHFNPASGRMNLRNGFDMFLHSHLDAKVNAAMQQKLGVKLHGPVCEALLPSCEEFRRKQDAAAGREQSTSRGRSNTPFRGFQRNRSTVRGGDRSESRNQGGNPHRTPPRGRNQRSPSPQRPSARKFSSPPRGVTPPSGSRQPAATSGRLDSASTSSSVGRRAEDVKRGLKIHNQCRALLGKKGIPCPGNLYAAINLCASEGLISPSMQQQWNAVRAGRNDATHQWD